MSDIISYYPQLKDKQILTDSRSTISVPSESVFFAFKGKHTNGSEFVPHLYAQGVRTFVGQELPPTQVFSPTNPPLFIQVENTLKALQTLVAHHRAQFSDLEAIGITGSNGKTIVKEWLSQLLQAKYALVKSPKSYNSQLGVPLSVWQIKPQHQVGIFEAGISKPHEMNILEKIIQPTIGIFTNIGTAHDEGFANRQEKVSEKLELFKNCKTLIYCIDYQEITEGIAQKEALAKVNVLTWGKAQNANIQILHIEKQTYKSIISLQLFEKEIVSLLLPFTDFASIENCMHCVVAMLHLGYEFSQVQLLISQQFEGKNKALPMRLELKKGIHQCTLIDDTYTNDLQALGVALDFMNQQQHQTNLRKKTVILSDILQADISQTNLEAQDIYQEVLKLLIHNKIDKLIGIGQTILTLSALADTNLSQIEKHFYPDTEAFIQDFLKGKIDFQQEQILVKGARKFQFDRITGYLQEKVHGTRLEIHLDALVHNLKYYKSLLSPRTKIMVMVKAFAYGSGSAEVASVLQYQNIDYLAVAYADEGAHLRESGIRLPIMVMNPSEESFDKLIQYQLEPEIYSFRILKQWINYLPYTQQADKTYKIHLKIDTGMRRLGFEPNEIQVVTNILLQNPHLQIASAFTHLAGADETQHEGFTREQLLKFEQATAILENALGYPFLKHALNSAGIVRFAEFAAKMDMVRLGIGLYGVEANGLFQANLQNVTTLKTSISQIKNIKKGETVGYGRRWQAQKDSKIGTIAIGYADGYDRRFSSGIGKVFINNRLAPIIGSVCMDMSMIDLTDVEAEEGDEVIVFGKEVSVIDLAKAIGTIPYELFTGIGERVKRVFFSE